MTVADLRTWEPFLEGEEAASGAALARELAEEVLAGVYLEGPSLAGGWAGAALMAHAFHRAFPGEGWDRRRHEAADLAAEGLASTPLTPALYGGFTGVAWALDRFAGPGEDGAEAIDEALVAFLEAPPALLDYDLVSGLAGFGLYAVDRAPRPAALRILQLVVDLLEASARPAGGGLTWHTAPQLLPPWQRELHPAGYYNLGLAHGVPGILGLLARMRRAALAGPRANRLLEGGLAWILAGTEGQAGYLAARVDDPEASLAGSSSYRPAWCYGELGAACAVLSAARSLDRGDAADWALSRASVMVRVPANTWGLQDGGLCHGAAGAMHLAHRLWRGTGDEAFRAAALDALALLLRMRRVGEAVGGWPSYEGSPEAPGATRPEAGLLEGGAGIALALLALVEDRPPVWDGFLLVDVG